MGYAVSGPAYSPPSGQWNRVEQVPAVVVNRSSSSSPVVGRIVVLVGNRCCFVSALSFKTDISEQYVVGIAAVAVRVKHHQTAQSQETKQKQIRSNLPREDRDPKKHKTTKEREGR